MRHTYDWLKDILIAGIISASVATYTVIFIFFPGQLQIASAQSNSRAVELGTSWLILLAVSSLMSTVGAILRHLSDRKVAKGGKPNDTYVWFEFPGTIAATIAIVAYSFATAAIYWGEPIAVLPVGISLALGLHFLFRWIGLLLAMRSALKREE